MALPTDFISALIGLLLTLLVFSYLLGDSPLFKIAVYIFVGVSAGYIAAVAWHQALMPSLFVPLFSATDPQRFLLLIPLVLGVLLLMKISPLLSRLGSVPMGFLVGVGAGVAIGGAVLGTLFPQIGAAIAPFDLAAGIQAGYNPFERLATGAIALAGTIGTLVYFHFGARAGADGKVRRGWLAEVLAWVGRIFIAVTLGVLFAGVYVAALTALIERLDFILSFFR